MAVYKIVVVVLVIATLAIAQRPFYAGTGAIGYPQLDNDAFQISNRFGEDEPVPIQVKNDKKFVSNVEKLPIDNRPFWYINWQQYDAFRKQPQTWPQRPNNFIDK
ncbi:uncharacterized protein LOC132902717 [Amyelois transitella]|uniref:uncharacterized protein LOC132902717 n=1 Tax=Amyelois transitella TaxID=680683 RepID=UPI002990395B|nr:uncharacterized protein LOC132902717 [Amyelois transitella]